MIPIKPAALRAGDTIGIAAPASNIKLELLEEGLRELQSLGFKTYFRPDIVSSYRYFAGSHERRRSEFIELLVNPEIRAIFCARGGYGSGHLVSAIDRELIRANPKIINGASDITVLLNHVRQAGVVAFHGPMVATTIRQGAEGYDRRLFLDLLQGGRPVQFPTEGTAVLRSGAAEGRLAGGCLSPMLSTLGTGNEIDTRDSILVIEDIDEKPYRIDRMILQLKETGKLRSVRGIVFGEMLNCTQHPDQGYTLEEVLKDLLSEFSFPVLYGFPTGHTSRPNVIVPFGVNARLVLDPQAPPKFELLEPAVTLQ